MRTLIRGLDKIIFVVIGLFVGLAGIVYIFGKGIFRSRRNFPKTGDPIRRLTFHIMDLNAERAGSDVTEDTLLQGSIAREISVFFDFESDTDSKSKVTENIECFNFSVHKKGRVSSGGMEKTRDLLNLIKNIFFLMSVCRKENINCVQSQEAVFLGIIGLIFSRFLQVPFILHLNTSYEMKYKGTGRVSVKFLRFRIIERWLEHLTMRLADVIVADRNFYKNAESFPKGCLQKYITTGVKVGKTHYSELRTRRDLKRELGIEGRDVVLYVGRLHPVKYVQDLIEAFQHMYKRYDNACLLIVGEGILKEKLEDAIKKYSLGSYVLFLGSKPQEYLKDIYFTADVIVQPHGGQVLLEAALAGTPSIAYDFDWHGEFIENGKMGFVVPFRDIEQLSRKTLDLLTDKKLKKELGRYSREVGISRYSRQRSVDNEKQIYDNLIRR